MSASSSSGGGQPILRYQKRRDFAPPAEADTKLISAIESHIEKHVGAVDWIFHEVISDQIHLDVLVSMATSQRPFHVLVTCGMSQKPMTVPPGAEELRYAELVLCLPPDWKLTEDAFKDDRNYFPLRWLKTLARLPHEYGSWLGYGHTIPNGDPPSPLSGVTELSGWMLDFPLIFGNEFPVLSLGAREIRFWCVLALHAAEMQFKLANSAEALVELLERGNVGQVLALKRKSVV